MRHPAAYRRLWPRCDPSVLDCTCRFQGQHMTVDSENARIILRLGCTNLMGGVCQGIIEASEDGIIVSALGSTAETLYVFDANLNRHRLGRQNMHPLGDELVQRYSVGVGGPVQKVRGDIRRDEFENLDGRRPELIAE